MDPAELIANARFGEMDDIEAFISNSSQSNIEDLKKCLSVCDDAGNTPLHMASANGHDNIVQLLLKYVEPSPNHAGNTPFHWACMNGHINVIKIFLEDDKFDPLVKNGAGQIGLDLAEIYGKDEAAQFLYERGAFEDDVPVNSHDAAATQDVHADGNAVTEAASDNVDSAEAEMENLSLSVGR